MIWQMQERFSLHDGDVSWCMERSLVWRKETITGGQGLDDFPPTPTISDWIQGGGPHAIIATSLTETH